MSTIGQLRVAALRAHYAPHGTASVGQLADLITGALEQATAQGARESLVDITGMHGFESPGPAYRRWLVRRWARLAAGRLRVALVAREEHVCPARTGLVVAAEEGLNAHIFTSEADAAAWLDSQAPPGEEPR